MDSRKDSEKFGKEFRKVSERGLKNKYIYVNLMAGQISGTPGSQFGEGHRLFSS